MAKNRKYESGDQLYVDVAAAAATSGSPAMFGQRPGVTLTDRDAAGKAVVAFKGVFALSVKGEQAAGNVAVTAGDILYYEAGQTPPVNKDATNGIRFGYALGSGTVVASGATTTIDVAIGY